MDKAFWRNWLRECERSWPTLAFSLSLWCALTFLLHIAQASNTAHATAIALLLILQWEIQP